MSRKAQQIAKFAPTKSALFAEIFPSVHSAASFTSALHVLSFTASAVS
jgi:hypothetical protein